MLAKETIKALAAKLVKAEDEVLGFSPSLTTEYPELTGEDAYAIQLEAVAIKTGRGERILGKKIGFTSEKIRQMFNVTEPDYGFLMNTRVTSETEPISMKGLIHPRIEAEIAFLLKEDLSGPDVSIADVYRATEGIMPAIEVIDSRIANWDIKLLDSIADNASNGKVLLGSNLCDLKDFDLSNMGLVVYKNGRLMESAAGAAVMGHPANAVAWLANTLYKFGITLKKNEIIMSGSFTPVFDIKAGDNVTASFDGLGAVSAVVVE